MNRLYTRDFALAFASQICFIIAGSALAHYSRWIAFLHGDERDIGWILGSAPTIGLLLRPYVGQWIDRLGIHASWVIGQIMVLVTVPANLLLYDIGPAIYVLRMSTVLGFAISAASSLTYISERAPPARRTEAIGVFGAAGFLGMIIGVPMADIFLNGAVRSRNAFEFYFGLITLATAASTLLLFFLPRDKHTATAESISLRNFFRTGRAHWPGSILLVMSVFGMCMTIPFGFLAKYIDKAGLDSFGLAEFFLVYASWGFMLRVGLRELPARWGARKVLLVGMTSMGLGMLCFLAVSAERVWPMFAAAILCGAGHSMSFHTLVSLATEPFPREARATGTVLALIHFDLGQIGGAPILGQIAYSSYSGLFIAISCLCFASAAIYASRCLINSRRKAGRPSSGTAEAALAIRAPKDSAIVAVGLAAKR